jgi:hypothetical protein
MENGHPKAAAFIHLAPRRHAEAAVKRAYIVNNISRMADGQPQFLYTDAQLQTLTTYISYERLRNYIASIKDYENATDRLRKAIKLYEKNTTYCEAMYTVMQGFEVTFRNAIHNRLTTDLATPWWFDILELRRDEREAITRAKQTIADKPQAITPDRVVGELSFGFWVKLFSGEYADTMWGPSLKNILPAGSERGLMYSRFKELKTLRNRIAHHNRIIGRPPVAVKQLYEHTLETIGWLDPTVRDWVAATNTFYPRFGRPLFARPASASPTKH